MARSRSSRASSTPRLLAASISTTSRFAAPDHTLTLLINGQFAAEVFSAASNCPFVADVERVVLGMNAYNAMLGGTDAVIEIVTDDPVDALCLNRSDIKCDR